MTETHEASCGCGQLTAVAGGPPIRVSACHCFACQRRTGSSFGAQARWPRDKVQIAGDHHEYVRISDDGEEHRFYFCPSCGATVFWMTPSEPKVIKIAVGAFADPSFPPPTRMVYADRRHPWVEITLARSG